VQAGNTGRVRYEYRTCPVYTISADRPQTCSFRFLSSNQTAGT